MAKVIVELDPDCPEEREKLDFLLHGWKYRGVIQEFDNYLRGRLKYEDLPEDADEALDKAREQLYSIAEEHDVKVWE